MFTHCRGDWKMAQPIWKTIWKFLTKLKNILNIWTSNHPTLRYFASQNKNLCSQKLPVHSIHNQQNWKAPKYPLMSEWINKLGCIQSMGYSSGIQRNKLIHATTWKNLKGIRLRKEANLKRLQSTKGMIQFLTFSKR